MLLTIFFRLAPLFLLIALGACALGEQMGLDRAVIAEPATAGPKNNATVPFTLDAGRVLLELSFEAPDGGSRKALAWFNMGMARPILTKTLFRELQIDRGQPLRVKIGDVALRVAPGAVVDGDGGLGAPTFEHLFAPRPVEAMLPASILQTYVVTIDYPRQALYIASPGGQALEGIAVPIALNAQTGLASVDATIGGRAYSFVIDAGAGYSWMRGDALKQLLSAHADWRRADGAIGPSNANMLDYAFETQGIVARFPEVAIGAVRAKDVGVLGTGPILGDFWDGLVGDFFWDNWQKSAPGPVTGWLGANVLKNFKLTIDYSNHMSYWLPWGAPDAHDLDSVGITLNRRGGHYFVAGLVRSAKGDTANGSAIDALAIGDELIAVDRLDARGVGKSEVLAALAGKPGERRILAVMRDGAAKNVEARVLDLR